MVELSEGIRKVRRVFLFHDVIVSSKQKPTRAGMKFEPKWYLPLSELSFHAPEESPEGLLMMYSTYIHGILVCSIPSNERKKEILSPHPKHSYTKQTHKHT